MTHRYGLHGNTCSRSHVLLVWRYVYNAQSSRPGIKVVFCLGLRKSRTFSRSYSPTHQRHPARQDQGQLSKDARWWLYTECGRQPTGSVSETVIIPRHILA
jgi:hypothetical protein